MIGMGDIVAVAGRSREMLVVEIEDDDGFLRVAWNVAGRAVEHQYHKTFLVLIRRPTWPKQRARGRRH